MKRKSRVLAAYILEVTGLIPICLALFGNWPLLWRFFALLPYLIGFVLHICTTLCPHCDRFTLPVRPWAKECTCKKCHKTVTFQ